MMGLKNEDTHFEQYGDILVIQEKQNECDGQH